MDTYLLDCKPTTMYSWLLFSFKLRTPSLVVSIDLNLLPETDPSKNRVYQRLTLIMLPAVLKLVMYM